MNLRYCNNISKNTCDIIKGKDISLADNGILWYIERPLYEFYLR